MANRELETKLAEKLGLEFIGDEPLLNVILRHHRVGDLLRECLSLMQGTEQLEMEVRENLWHHGHDHLYGDDGEMQCSQCREWDYKRGDLNVLREQAHAARMEAFAKKLAGREIGQLPKEGSSK